MKVVVEVTVAAREDLVALLAARMPTEGDAARFGAEFIEDIKQQFRDHDGLPPGVDPKGPFELTFTVVQGDRAIETKTHLD